MLYIRKYRTVYQRVHNFIQNNIYINMPPNPFHLITDFFIKKGEKLIFIRIKHHANQLLDIKHSPNIS
jgi:hypothetical protein